MKKLLLLSFNTVGAIMLMVVSSASGQNPPQGPPNQNLTKEPPSTGKSANGKLPPPSQVVHQPNEPTVAGEAGANGGKPQNAAEVSGNPNNRDAGTAGGSAPTKAKAQKYVQVKQIHSAQKAIDQENKWEHDTAAPQMANLVKKRDAAAAAVAKNPRNWSARKQLAGAKLGIYNLMNNESAMREKSKVGDKVTVIIPDQPPQQSKGPQ
jgi:hypothetical protein